ncbi:sensor domain-containing diguanylate cyclase [Zobellella endophytica]|uniref:sensor domain-containing diguanylate cyclase n=1 Tax=Zobellella endophytica TaxID=2116700 RepID=UPI001FE4914B|nr:sensor domain-containing diguanylate cyclase [Zobellella endophytica]
MIHNTLESNRVYAAKLADSAGQFFDSAKQQLSYSAGLMAGHVDDAATLQAEAERLYRQTDSFNSAVIVNRYGQVLAASPDSLRLKGARLDSPGARQALQERCPLITLPYLSASNNLVVSLSYPIFSADNRYLGYVGGALYLREKNILNALLGEHYYNDGSYLYVVDSDRHLICHLTPERVGEVVNDNPVIEAVIQGKAGVQRLVNSQGVDMLAGYAPVPAAGWGVVAQRPTAATLAELDDKMLAIFIRALLFTLVTLPLIWFFAALISKPLWQLASNAHRMDSDEVHHHITGIHSWYYEAAKLKRALLRGIGLLHEKISQLNIDSLTDSMTGLLNHRGMQVSLEKYREKQQPFSIIALDIDHFKAINDNHGHDVGDRVIKSLARLMRDNSRETDLLCRSGGEEFMILLPDGSLDIAVQIAERLRACTESQAIPDVGRITISLGITHCPPDIENLKLALKIADMALYEAKKQGRNRVVRSPDGLRFVTAGQKKST